MSQENVESVRRMYEAFDGGDTDGALSYLDPDVVIDATHRVDGAIGRGHDEVVAILAEWLGTWDDFRQEIDDVLDLGDLVVAISTQTGRGKGSGIEWENRFAMLYEFRQGKVIRWTIYDEPDTALEAAGLSE